MNLDDFIDSVFLRFPPKTNDIKPIELWYSDYKTALKSNNVYNYQSAFNDFLKNYKYAALPTPGTLLGFLNNHIINRENEALEHIRAIKRGPKFNIELESDDFKNRIKAKLQAIGIKSKLKALQ